MSLNEYALTRGAQVVAGRTEEEVYRALGLAFIPPELREAGDEIDLAARGALPRLIEPTDLRADLHLHTDRTDGRESLETMVRACRERGYQYCAITDHSQALAMASGFNEDRVRRSVGEIDAARRAVPGIRVLHGLEVDILQDGALDLADDALELLDWVVVSIHSRFDQNREAATERVLRAISHPLVHAMGHPTGRMIGRREPLPFDLERVLARAAELGVAMEINGQPDRTDLSDVNARLAAAKGVPLVICTDAHNLVEMDFMRYGLFAARRAGLTRDQVLNTLPFEKFRGRIRRRGAAPAAAAATPKAPAPATASSARSPAARKAATAPPMPAKRTAQPKAASRARAKSAAPKARSKAAPARRPARGKRDR